MTVVTTADTSQLYALAARHGLKLHGPLTVNELGLDYRIVIATVDDGRRWVLRIPRRAEVSAKVEPEARVLAMLKNRLPFAVPDWRVANAELVAYPMLEDSTAMVIQPGSSPPDWVVPQDSEVFAESFATALAALHAVPISAAVDAGMLIRTPTQARQKVADDVDRVRREFVVNDKRLHRWQRWLDDDSSWPDFSVVVHGDLYVGHVLIDNTERVSGMIDWSEARVDDPAIDMAAHLMVFGEEGLAKLLLTYEAAGGRVWPRLAHHIAERLAFGAVTYALFALDSGNEEYLAAAKAQLAAAEAAE
ncbi:TPA: Mph(A) family macrolide 2'-phosphotransferase [Klebsiella pneumoniae]|nr:Mph(A) family macrolide 2'-phosphotransferase [Klebsiella pneumoniae]